MRTEKSHLKKDLHHVGRKVVIGYVALIVIAVFSLIYIYTIVQKIAAEEDINSVPRQKIYLVTQTQTLLYESEAMGQLLDMEDDDFSHFNETLDQAHANMDSLRVLVADELLLARIDTIDMLIERKRMNTGALLEIWQEANKDLYAKNIEKALATQVAAVEERDVKENVTTQKDTLVVSSQKRGFLKRLKEVFVPTDTDSSVIISQNEKLLKDTQLKAYDPNEAISKTLKNIQSNVASERERLRTLLVDQSAALRYDNSLINSRINQILRAMEEEELTASLVRLERRQSLLGKTAYLITGIALLSIFVILFFVILIGRDLFRSRYYREQLEKVVQSRERLILTISHDVRAPLSSIIGYTELMQRYRHTEQQSAYLRNIAGSSKHILSLVNDLLDYQRLEAGQMDLHEVPFRVPDFFREISDSFLLQAKAKGLDYNLQIENETDQVYSGDSVRIRQVVGNLINNAIKFTPEGKVELLVDCVQPAPPAEGVAAADPQLIITVRDSGPGIEPEQQQKIFADFARLPGAEKAEGFGLGLSITSRLVTLLGGKIELQSEVGQGSAFTVTLPLKEADNQTICAAEDQSESIAFEEGTVTCLVVDDDLLQVALIEEVLKRCNVRVLSCTNPYTVVDFLEKHPVDILLSDVQMPGMDGLELIRQIRASAVPEINALPAIVLSGSVGKDESRYREAGFTGCLSKPFTAEGLVRLVASLLPEDKQLKNAQGKAIEKSQTAKGEKILVDFSGLTEFAGDDEDASAAILKTFFVETAKHVDWLKEALEATDRERTAEIAHKLIPLFTTLGTDTLVQQLKILQQNQPELTHSGWTRLVTDVIEQASSIVDMQEELG
ncbi:ATP-binding protein [Parabacteroides sp. PF5-6]|uniref:ATP-binding protein n=1 Tax=Parabacteroides sp. PF5-6 TaxID=1742403 RepID=UPI0024062B44|nr:ATP-binding protein [Parabacteroides sp. PF5-6]MDF9829671.1 signal transduction histidine kinase/DNA-binding response OmpR family regulator [Parabacteroides sp. PF5-6]